jgi:PKD repeat protein
MLMFRRIVSQLSLSPSAVSELAFYARRLQQERITRTFSAIAAVLVVALQFATIALPPTPANAASPSDIIHGGVTSKDDLLNRYDESPQVQAIYRHFGVERRDLEKAKSASINTLDRSYKSLGRVQHLASDTPIDIGNVTYWQRGLYTWDTGSNLKTGSTYQVFAGNRSLDGGYFAIMVQCGNIVVKTNPATPKPTVKPPVPTPLPTPAPTPKGTKLACTQLTADVSSGEAPLTVRFTGLGAATGDSITDWLYDFGDKNTDKRATGSVVHVYQNPGKFIVHLQVRGSSGHVSDACTVNVEAKSKPAVFTKKKAALNLTENIDATTRPAQPGDEIKYVLTTKNTGGTGTNYVVTEHITDVLEYADVTDAGGAKVDESGGVLVWPGQVLGSGATMTRSFTVKVKNPVPPTPIGLSDKSSYDLRMDNIYGNAIQVAVAPPVAKQVEAAATSLPATGAPVATLIVLTVSGLTLFFYFRNRQLLKEVKLLRNEYQGGL